MVTLWLITKISMENMNGTFASRTSVLHYIHCLYIQMHVYSFKRLHEKAHGLWFVRHNFYFNNCNKKRTVENSEL